ncbi:MAG: hypothetical protein ACW99Q_17695, partial [Candidatus Kariarchaeaceae archaeon]
LQSELSVAISRLLMIIFALPQIGIYVLKIARKKEFTFAKTKLFIRLMFIISFFFSLINFSNDVFGSLIIIFFGILIFTKTRKFSDYRLNNDKHLVSIVDTTKDSLVSRVLVKLNIFNSNGEVKDLEENSSFLEKSYFVILIGILYYVGFILISSHTPLLTNCNNDVVKSVVFSTPWIVAKSSNSKFCTNCGEASPRDFRFCESCGTQFQMEGQAQPETGYYPPQGNMYQGNRGYSGQGYQPYGDQGYRRDDRSRSIPIFVGIGIFLIATVGTGNIVLGLVLGVIGYFGTQLAMSTNSPCLSYCIMSQVCDCVCSAMGAENRRKGNL